MGIGAWRPRAQFEASAEFVVVDEGACLLLADAGVECLADDGTIRSAGLPPANRIFGGGPLCVSVLDGGLQCVYRSGYPAAFDLSGLISVVASSEQLLCAERAADAGVRCVAKASASAPFDVSPRPLALWIMRGIGNAYASYPSGVTILPWGLNASLPMEDAGYIWGWDGYGATCGIREDGQLRCAGLLNWGSSPPIGVELFDRFESGCGLTRDHRVRCTGGEPYRSLPPPPPVRQVRVFDDAYYLLESGLIAGRGSTGGPGVLGPGPALEDRFSQLPSGFFNQQCALRVDQSATCWGGTLAPVPPPTARYRKLVHGYGLKVDGGVDSWSGLTDMATATDLLDVGNQFVCGRIPDGTWTCSPPLPVPLPPRPFLMVAARGAGTCALEADGKLECWPAPPPAFAMGRRYRHLSNGDGTNTTCAVTVEGEVICWRDDVSGPIPIEIPWDDFVTFEWSRRGGCGVRRDGTAPCVGVYKLPWD